MQPNPEPATTERSSEDGRERLGGCMEVWGGNQAVDSGVVMAGLDVWVWSRPHAGAQHGGDVYYVSSCATGRITRIVVADVSGHGELVSEISDGLRQLLRRHVNRLDQSRFVQTMNDEFASLTRAGRFATALVGTFFAPTGHLTFCNAGHPPPLRWSVKQRAWSLLTPEAQQDSGGLPLGIVDGAAYHQVVQRLAVGDLVLFYTDPLIEIRDEQGHMLGPEGLLELVQALGEPQKNDFLSQLREALRSRSPEALDGDDATLLLFRPNGLAPRIPIGERIGAVRRMMAAVIRSLLPGGQPVPWPDFRLANIGGALLHPLNRFWRG